MSFKLNEIFHIIHVTDDYAALDAWYENVFGAIRYTDGRPNFPYLAAEKRNATLTSMSDMCIEPISPAQEYDGWEQMPIGKFFNRFGPNWYSIAWHLDEPLDLYHTLREHGVRFAGLGGSTAELTDDDAFFTHPKDTICALEFMSRKSPSLSTMPDPRFTDPAYNKIDWKTRTPLGFESTGYISVMTRDLERARLVFGDWMKGEYLGESASALTHTQDTYFKLGDAVVQLTVPLEEDSIVGADHALRGDAIHAVAWKVADLNAAEKFLNSQGVKTLARDEHTLLADNSDTFGAYHRFTDLTVAEALA